MKIGCPAEARGAQPVARSIVRPCAIWRDFGLSCERCRQRGWAG